jgi:hypothetical protein
MWFIYELSFHDWRLCGWSPAKIELAMSHDPAYTLQRGFMHAGIVATVAPFPNAILERRAVDQALAAGADVKGFACKRNQGEALWPYSSMRASTQR